MRVIKNLTFKILIPFLFVGCGTRTEVNYVGNLEELMHGVYDSAKIDLKDLEGKPHLYALGALNHLAGEVLIYDSYPMIANFRNVLFVIDRNFDFKASLLVYTQVESWESIEIPESLRTMGGLETFISEIAGPYGLKSKPFPFLVDGEVALANWHVVNGAAGDNHSAGGISGQITNEKVRILGFYSESHQGIFTHKDSRIHAHIINEEETIVGHLDGMELKKMVLKIPK